MLIKGIRYFITIVIGGPIYLISKIFPKKKDLTVIGSNLGLHFADNPKYYYIQYYTSSSPKNRNLVWISKNKDVVNMLNNLDLPAEYLYSSKGIYMCLRASNAIISHQLTDINGSLVGGAKIVQLWHAMALRKVGYGGDWYDDNFKGKFRKFIAEYLPYSYYMTCDYLLAPCQKAKENSYEAFSFSFRNNKIQENIFIARQPRTLCLEEDFVLPENFFPEKIMLESINQKYDKIVSWLPTQRRQFGKTIIDVIKDSSLNLKELNEFCRHRNWLFIIKAHFLDLEEVNEIAKEFNNIFTYEYADPYPMLKFTDVLITDYSSVFFDFILVDRPILFMSYDLEEYRNTAKFYYEYEDLQIGPIFRAWSQILEELVYIDTENDRFKNQRNQTLKSFEFETSPVIKFPNEI
nr:CDP-glycerol glycerophosphotransferase family protein [uncultured Allomuricauda sp.]